VRRVKRSAEIAITAEGRQGGGVPPHFKEPCDAGFRTKTKALGRGQCEASQAERRSYDKAGRKAKRRRVRVNGGLRIPTDAPRSPRRGRGRPLLSWLVRKKQKQISQTVDRSQARRCPTLPSPGTWAAPSDCEADRPSTSLRTGRSPKRLRPHKAIAERALQEQEEARQRLTRIQRGCGPCRGGGRRRGRRWSPRKTCHRRNAGRQECR
jgi:hypothetical protein